MKFLLLLLVRGGFDKGSSNTSEKCSRGKKENFAPFLLLETSKTRLVEAASFRNRCRWPSPSPPPPSCRELNFYSCANDAAIFRSLKWALKLSGQFGREDVLLFSNQRKGLLHLHPSFVSVLMNPSSNVTSFLQRGGHRYCRILTRPNNNSPSTRSLASRPILHVVEGEEKRKKKKKKNREPIPP